jgi:hypothetical protein
MGTGRPDWGTAGVVGGGGVAFPGTDGGSAAGVGAVAFAGVALGAVVGAGGGGHPGKFDSNCIAFVRHSVGLCDLGVVATAIIPCSDPICWDGGGFPRIGSNTYI